MIRDQRPLHIERQVSFEREDVQNPLLERLVVSDEDDEVAVYLRRGVDVGRELNRSCRDSDGPRICERPTAAILAESTRRDCDRCPRYWTLVLGLWIKGWRCTFEKAVFALSMKRNA